MELRRFFFETSPFSALPPEEIARLAESAQKRVIPSGERLFAEGDDAGTTYAIVVSTQFVNWSAGGDTLNTPGATYATLRTFQQAAATAKATTYPGRVAYCDLYTYMRNLIVAGTYAEGDHLWHTADMNQHLNVAGEAIVADAVLATIQAQTGWLAALKAG